MKRILIIFTLLTSLFFHQVAFADAITLPKGDFQEMRKTGRGTVEEVINPLSVKLKDGRVIHLSGLDYPDLDFYEPGDISITAVKIMDDFLKNQNVDIYQTKDSQKGRTNRMGHSLAHIVRADDQIWLQGMLLSLGVARTRTTKHNNEMATQMLSLESKARDNKLGLWEMSDFQILSPLNTTEHIGSFQIVEGTVNSVTMKKDRLYLNYGNDWKEDFTVSISKADLRDFSRDRIDPQQWNGDYIRVRGWIESYNGPYMEIDHPQRFEVGIKTKHKEEEEIQDKREITGSGSALPQSFSRDTNKREKPRTQDKGSALPVLND